MKLLLIGLLLAIGCASQDKQAEQPIQDYPAPLIEPSPTPIPDMAPDAGIHLSKSLT